MLSLSFSVCGVEPQGCLALLGWPGVGGKVFLLERKRVLGRIQLKQHKIVRNLRMLRNIRAEAQAVGGSMKR